MLYSSAISTGSPILAYTNVLNDNKVKFSDVKVYATPRRIAVIVDGLENKTEDEEKIVFPTCCHNLDGGSPKLYYYTNTHLFVCYTHCGSAFDIFDLLIKMEKLRGNDITLAQAVEKCGYSNVEISGKWELENKKKGRAGKGSA